MLAKFECITNAKCLFYLNLLPKYNTVNNIVKHRKILRVFIFYTILKPKNINSSIKKIVYFDL